MHPVCIIFLVVFGASIGSFLNVVIWRLPRGESIVFPGSHCPSCGRAIQWYDNVPILSWLVLGGRCRFCRTRISPRYLLIETITALLLVGLYAAYYLLNARPGMGRFADTWPTFVAYATLLCALLACSAIDIESYHVPLEICWFASLVGLAASTARPQPQLLPEVSPTTGAACLGAVAGLITAVILMRRGLIQPSFIDAEPHPKFDGRGTKTSAHHVAITAENGVRPRREVLWEILFLAPAFIGAIGAWLLVTHVEGVAEAWRDLFALGGGRVGNHLNGLFASLFGYLIGGLWIWGMRILGTLGFGKEAMGLGDVHILAAAGAVGGWEIPTMAFFLAPVFGLLWALYLLARRGQRELPYGPWLSAGVLAALLFYDRIDRVFEQFSQVISTAW
jgi:leader peptidase (prepilin peptidase)/N-methyltransferase